MGTDSVLNKISFDKAWVDTARLVGTDHASCGSYPPAHLLRTASDMCPDQDDDSLQTIQHTQTNNILHSMSVL